jgi:Phytanoyl-CoA dioxygenase (PhyH)
VDHHQGKSLPGLDPEAFAKRGYTIVRGLFDASEAEELRKLVSETFIELEQQGRVGADPGDEGTIKGVGGDLLSIPSLRHVLLDPRILRVAGELLGGEPVYFGDSSVRVGANGKRAWHRDNVNRRKWRRGPDWHGTYPLLRCGLYLQDHAHHSGGLALRPRSHDAARPLPTLAKLVDTKAGDLVAWNLRTLHSGEVVRMRGLPTLPLNPRVQSRLPPRLRVPDDRQRIVLFMGFALADRHLDNYLTYLRTRDYMLAAWEKSRFPNEVWEEAEQAGLRMLRPVPAYGTP